LIANDAVAYHSQWNNISVYLNLLPESHNPKVADWVPDEVIEFLSSRTMAMVFIQSLTEMNTRNLHGF
jgi:hypothetical protein